MLSSSTVGRVYGDRLETTAYLIAAGVLESGRHTESFNRRFRAECFNITMFWSLAQAWVVTSDGKAGDTHCR